MPWAKGVSGNPKGYASEETVKLRNLARAHGPAAIATLAEIMQDKSARTASRVAAASELLDRGFGKAPVFQTDDAEKFREAVEMSDTDLVEFIEGRSRPRITIEATRSPESD